MTNTHYRVIVLCGPKLQHKHTCATLIKQGVNVVGICEADERVFRLPISYLQRSVIKKGFGVTISRATSRLLYLLLNSSKDRAIFASLFDEKGIVETLCHWTGQFHRTRKYSEPKTVEWLRSMEPDIFVVHTGQIIGKAILELPKKKIVLGGHPGIIPHYRGSHSAFWAIYQGRPEDVGCSVFLLNEEVDNGYVIAQERVPIAKGDSFFTLAWKAMILQAHIFATVLRNFDNGVELPKGNPPSGQRAYFDNPTLPEYIRYRSRAKQFGMR